MAVAIYARKSTESEDRQVQSLDDQLSELNHLATKSGIVVAETIIESKSAKEPYTRPEFQRLIQMIQEGRVTGIMTWHINRLSRNMIDGGIISHLLQQGKLHFILTPHRRYSPEDSALLLAIENGMATTFIQDLKRAVKRGMKGKVERGWLPGPAPLGYENNKLNQTIEPHPTKFDLVKKGWHLVLEQDYTMSEVTREWQRLGLTSSRSANRNKPPSKSSVDRILGNPFYAGYIRFQGELYKGSHLPMITMEQFERVQRLLGRGARRRERRRAHVLSGLFKCPVCGCAIVGETKRKAYGKTGRQVDYTYYHCTGFKGCSKRGVPEDAVLRAVAHLVDMCKPQKWLLEWLSGQLDEASTQDQVTVMKSREELQRQKNAAEKRLRSLTELRIDGELSPDEFAMFKGETEEHISTLSTRMASVESEEDRVRAYVMQKLGDLEQSHNYDDAEWTSRRGIIGSLAEKCFLTLDRLVFQLDPVIAKIATFEPLENCSQSLKVDDSACGSLVWGSLVDDILQVASEKIKTDAGSEGSALIPVAELALTGTSFRVTWIVRKAEITHQPPKLDTMTSRIC